MQHSTSSPLESPNGDNDNLSSASSDEAEAPQPPTINLQMFLAQQNYFEKLKYNNQLHNKQESTVSDAEDDELEVN